MRSKYGIAIPERIIGIRRIMKSAVQGRVVINLAKQRGSEDEDEDELVWWGDGGICKNVSVLVSGVTKKSFVS